MPFEIKQVSPRKWNMINIETGAIHSHKSKAKAEAHMRLVNSMDSLTGKGLIEQKYIDSLRDPSPNFPPKVPLPTIGNFEINVPPYVVKPIQRYGTGKFKNSFRTVGYKLVKTLTKTRNLSSREDGITSINLIPETHETDATVDSWGSMPTLDQFSKKDQAIIKKLFLKPNKNLYTTNKQRGFPEVLPKNIERHRELGTSQLPDDFVAPPPRKRGRPKKASVAELQAQAEAQAQDMGLGDEIDFGDDETPASTPRTPRTPKAKTPRTPTPRPRGSPLPALRMPTNEEMGFDDDGNDLPTPRARTPTPKAPTPKEAPVKKRGRPTKYGDDDEARNQSSKEQKKLSAQLIYRNSLSQEARDKYDAKQAKKAGKPAPAPAPAPAPPTPRPKTPRPQTPQPPTPQPSISPVSSASSSSSSLSKEDKKAEKMAKKLEDKKAEKLADKYREKVAKKIDEKYPDLSPSDREKMINKTIEKKSSGKGILNDIKSSFVNLGNKVVKETKDLTNKATDLFTNVSQTSKAYPPNLTAIKNEVGQELITSLQIGRTPVPSAISSAMNAVSLGGFNKVFKSLPFDTLFHLFLIITTDKGKFLLEKNERINVSKNIPSKDLQVKDVVIPNNLSVNELIDTTQKYMGVNFLPYDPANQNCQDFISSVLRANNISTPDLLSFVKQDTSEIFKQNPNLAKISRKLTDIGAAINVVQQGGSLKIKSKHNNMDSRNMFSHQLPQAESQVRASLGIMRGGNILGDIGNAFKSIPRKAAKALNIPTSVNDLKNLAVISQIPTDVGGVKRYGKTALTYTLPSLGAATLGGLAGYATGGNPYAVGAAGTVGGIVGRVGAEQANKQIGEGVGRRRGRPRKMGGGMIVKHGGVAMPMSGQGWFDKVLDTSFTPRQAIRAAKSVPALGREAIQDIKGVGVLSKFLDSSVTPRQAIRAAKSVPALGREAIQDIKGVGVGKGSQAMKDKMARLRAMRRK